MKLIKSGIFCLLIATLIFVGCKKDCATPPETTPKTRLELFTGVTWKYDEYHTNYNNSNTLLVFKAGKPNNSLDLSAIKVKFNKDGTVQEWQTDGSILPGTWKFLNNETQYEVKNSSGTYLTNIISLDEKTFYWTDLNRLNGIYSKMIPY